MVNTGTWRKLHEAFAAQEVTLVAVSKTKPVADIQEMYDLGQRDFGENYVQELADKQQELPADIRWHYIGHLQSNKVKYIAPFVHLIHGVDSYRLLVEINKQAAKSGRVIDVLLQLHIADEETKFGLDEAEVLSLLEEYSGQENTLQNIRICGLMAMATNTEDKAKVAAEFKSFTQLFNKLKTEYFADKDYFSIRSIGMSSDYEVAIAEGANMVRIGSLLFGERNYHS
jgi:pyridoxal phosphate enzyme (YggS family)